MPLRIKCPNGCLIQVPSKRAGKSARCPTCKSVLVVPFPPANYQPSTILDAPFSSVSDNEVRAEDASTEKSPPPPKTSPSPPIAITADGESSASKPVIHEVELETGADSVSTFQIELDSPVESSGLRIESIEDRTLRANEDRKTLSRFFALMLVLVGLVNFAPAAYCWYTWSQADIDFVIPRWIYLQIFIAVLHWVYAVLLIQVPDWSTLRSIAVVMLCFAFFFGLASMGLWVGGAGGQLARFLQIPVTINRQAFIWCVTMLVLAVLASYLAGRESAHWQRTEKLLAEIMGKRGQPELTEQPGRAELQS